MGEPAVKMQKDELEEMKSTILQIRGDLQSVDEGIHHNDHNQIEAHAHCATGHVEYLWYLVMGEHLDERSGEDTT